MNLEQFYLERFGSDPYTLLDEAYDDIAPIANAAGIDWSDVHKNIFLANSGGKESKYKTYEGKYPTAINAEFKGRVDLFSRINISKEGIQYPFINFVSKGFDAGTWSGLSFLFSEFKKAQELSTGTMVPTPDEIKKQEEDRAEKEKERLEKQRLNEIEAEKAEKDAIAKQLKFSDLFDKAPLEDGSHPYAVKKGISEIFSHTTVKLVNEWDHGPNAENGCLAIPFTRLDRGLDGNIVGYQRIYPDGRKLFTKAINSGDYTGACHIIGDLKKPNKQRFCIAEGFASTASSYLSCESRFDVVFMAGSAGNIIHVVKAVIDIYPDADLWLALDNDAGSAALGKGNTGLKVGIDILMKYPTVKAVYPIPDESYGSKNIDFNDVFLQKGAAVTKKEFFSDAARLRVPTSFFEAHLQALAVTAFEKQKRDTFTKQLRKCIDAGMALCPLPHSPRELQNLIYIHLDKIGVGEEFHNFVKTNIARRFALKSQRAQLTRSFSKNITDPAKRKDHINYRKFDKPEITPELLEYVKTLKGPVIVRAGMGSGKSRHLLRPLMQEADRGVGIAHRVSLCGAMADMMSKDDAGKKVEGDILKYDDSDVNGLAPYASKLMICLNSIILGKWRPLLYKHDFLGLDEATQGIRTIFSGDFMRHSVDVFNRLIDSIAATEGPVLLVDADANDVLVDFAELAVKRREKMNLSPWSQIHIIELPVDVTYKKEDGTRAPRRINYTDKNRIEQEIEKAVAANERILLATDNAAFGSQILATLEYKFPNKKWLFVGRDTKSEEAVEMFTDNPGAEAVKYDGLIYSPAISSGVSIEVKHFHRHFGVFSGVVVPSDAVQMLRRDRTATEFMIGFDKMASVKRETNEKVITDAYAKAMAETMELIGLNDIQFHDGRVSFGMADTEFAQLKCKINAEEALARNDFANNLLCILAADGYELKHMAEDEVLSLIGKETLKAAKGILLEAELLRLAAAETPSEEERDKLLTQRSLSADERAQLHRWNLEQELNLAVNEENFKFLENGGMRQVERAELLGLDELTAKRIDRLEQESIFTYQVKRFGQLEFINITAQTRADADKKFLQMNPDSHDFKVNHRPVVEGPSRSFCSIRQKYMRQYLTLCGIDPDTGTGKATQAGMNAGMDFLYNSDNKALVNVMMKMGVSAMGNQSPKRASTLFKSFCAAIGWKTESERLGARGERVWSIEPNSFKFIKNILNYRAATAKSFFTNKLSKGSNKNHDPVSNSNIYIRSEIGSPVALDVKGVETIAAAISDLPISIEWARSALPLDELKELLKLPVKLLRATLASLYFTEKMHELTSGDYQALKLVQTGGC